VTGEKLTIEQADLDEALKGFSPASSWGMGQGSSSSLVTGWEDVGGMSDVREALQEALELPTKFAKLLAT
jgi:peroxin-1